MYELCPFIINDVSNNTKYKMYIEEVLITKRYMYFPSEIDCKHNLGGLNYHNHYYSISILGGFQN